MPYSDGSETCPDMSSRRSQARQNGPPNFKPNRGGEDETQFGNGAIKPEIEAEQEEGTRKAADEAAKKTA